MGRAVKSMPRGENPQKYRRKRSMHLRLGTEWAQAQVATIRGRPTIKEPKRPLNPYERTSALPPFPAISYSTPYMFRIPFNLPLVSGQHPQPLQLPSHFRRAPVPKVSTFHDIVTTHPPLFLPSRPSSRAVTTRTENRN
jgi:hypothetical protein